MAEGKRNTLRNTYKEETQIEPEFTVVDNTETEIEEKVTKRKPAKEKEEKEEKKPRAKKASSKLSFTERVSNWMNETFSFLNDEKFQKITGLSFLLFSAYLAIALTSYLFTWQIDQDKVMGGVLFSPEVTVENWLGKFGASLSHLFMHRWFGVSSYLISVLAFGVGIKLLMKVESINIFKWFRVGYFPLLWTSVTLGYLFTTKWFYLGGGLGYTSASWLNGLLGYTGTGILLVFSSLVYGVVVFNLSFRKITEPDAELTEAEMPKPIMEMEVQQPIVETFKEPIVNTLVTPEQVVETPQPLELNVEADELEDEEQEEEEEEENAEEGVQFTVAQTTNQEQQLTPEQISEVEQNLLAELGEYDPKLDLSSYQLPGIDLLQEYPANEHGVNKEELENNKNRIVTTLANYGIQIDKIKATIGPTVTLYEIIPAAGVRISKIKSLEDDIALSLAALGIRIIAPIPGKGTIGIEVPNLHPQMVPMRNLIASEKFQNCNMELPVALGKTISGETFVTDLAKMPHLLMAGATGQGKSVGLNAILVSLLYKMHPAYLKLVMIDPKKVELTLYSKIERHFLAKLPDAEKAIITDSKKAIHTLNSLVIEMEERYELLEKVGLRNIKEYNTKFIARKLNPNDGHKFLPYIVVVIDEFADFIAEAGKEIEMPIARLAQKARAIGIHLIIATQRPSVNVITGIIKANFPARIAFRVSSKIDSRTILDAGGADQLIGKGDMLVSTGNDLVRVQCGFVDTPEVEQICQFIGNQRGYTSAFNLPEFVGEDEGGGNQLDASDRDPLFNEAAHIVVQHQQGSASLLQRRLKLGYNRAGRIVDQLEAAGIIGGFEGSKAREVKIKDILTLEQFLNQGEKTN